MKLFNSSNCITQRLPKMPTKTKQKKKKFPKNICRIVIWQTITICGNYATAMNWHQFHRNKSKPTEPLRKKSSQHKEMDFFLSLFSGEKRRKNNTKSMNNAKKSIECNAHEIVLLVIFFVILAYLFNDRIETIHIFLLFSFEDLLFRDSLNCIVNR